MTDQWAMFTADWCSYCTKAKVLFEAHKINPQLLDVSDPYNKSFLQAGGHKTIPQIYLNGELIGGYDKLVAYFNAPVQLELPLEPQEG